MFDVALPHDPRLDAGVLIDRMLRLNPNRYWFELDCRRPPAIRGRVFLGRIARAVRVGLSLRVIQDAARSRTHVVLRPVVARRAGLVARAITFFLYPLLLLLAVSIRRDVRKAAYGRSARTVVEPAHGARATDAYAATVLYVPIRATARFQALRARSRLRTF